MDKNQLLFYETLRLLVGPLIKARLRLHIEGQDNVPDLGPAVVVCNHRSGIDPVILAYAVRNRYIQFGAASWSWNIPVYGQLHKWLGAFPLNLSGGEGARDQLKKGLELLEQGELVGIFPEGGETILDPGKSERIKRFKTGFARLALEARVPVIPAAVVGLSERRLPSLPGSYVEKIARMPGNNGEYSAIVYKRAMCRIGTPIDLGELYDEPISRSLLDMISNKMRQVITRLYNGEDLDRFMRGTIPFDFANERVGAPRKLL
jgi:1-acyl-sn-glycerol-3-phosphate acyltransferase